MSSNDMNKTARQFYKAVEGVKTKKSGGYDTQATVRRIEDGIAWVHIPDGVDETPARMTISAKVGDVVQVRIVNGRAFLVGNASAPPTDNTEAVKAMGQAGLAAEAAGLARQKADEAVQDAATAHEAAMIAQDAAESAQDSADAAQTSADNAQASATTANQAANSALAGLGTVESVLDVVTWFSEHKTATTDTTVQAGKSYYEYDASTGVLTKVDPEGTENPSEEGWYELDEAITNYVSTHLAQTNDGLNVVSSINGWRVLISSGGGNYNAGVYLIDPNGNIAQSTTAAGVAFNTGKPVNIGDSTAYINFDGNGHITVVGADFTIGGANNVSGTLTVKDASGNTIGTWDNSGIMLTAGSCLRVNAPDGRNVMNLGVLNNIEGYAHVSYDVENPNGQTVFPMNSGDMIIPREVISCKYDNDGSDVGIPVTIQQQQDGNYAFVFDSAPLRAFHLVYSTDSLILTTTIGTRVTENTRGINSILIGCENDTYFQGSIAIGNMIDNRAAWSTGIGLGLQVGKAFQTILGRFNDPTPTYSNQKDIFVIGNGTSDDDRFNLMTLTDWGWLHTARYYSGEKRGWSTGTGVGISDDGKIILQRTTSGSNAINSDNPLIYFANADASHIIGLIFTDSSSVQAPAALTLAGNQGGEYFIAPNIKITGSLYNQYGNTYVRPNVDNWLRINDLGAYSSGVYFGSSLLRTDGYFQVGGTNPVAQYRGGSIEFTGNVAKATAPSATQYKNIVFLDNGGRDSYHRLASIEHYKTTANENVLQFGVYNHMAGTGSNSWPVGIRLTIDRNQNYFITFWGNMINTSVYNNTASNAANMFISSSGTFCRSTASSKRYKHDIKTLTNYNDILNIPVVSYKYNTDYLSSFDKRYNIDIPGFIAEDIEKYYPIATEYNDNGEVEDWNVRIIIPPMLAVIKDLKGHVEELSAEIDRMKKGMKAS